MADGDEEQYYMKHFTEDDGKRYQFDFQALSKMKRREKIKMYTMTCIILLLLVALVAMVILYTGKKSQKEGTKKETWATLAVKLQKAKTIAYQKIAKYGEDCHTPLTRNHTICGKNAYCRKLQGTYRCDCFRGFVGDGIGDCKDVHFAINFKNPTTKNIPELRRIHFPETDSLSVCFWFKLEKASAERWLAAFMFTSVDIDGDNDFMIWVTKDQVHVYLRSSGTKVLTKKFAEDKWSHLCWVWQTGGKWWVYLNGKKENAMISKKEGFLTKFPDSSGNLLLGQDKDEDTINQKNQMLHGSVTQFFVFNKRLTDDEIFSVYENRPPTESVIVGWWQFKNITKGTDIIETAYPQEILDFS